MWEVYRSNCCMAVDTCDWSLVSFKHLTDSSFAVSEYTTKVNWSGNQTSADRDSTEMQFKYSHKKVLLPYMDVTPLQKALPQQDHRRPGLKTDLKFNMYFLLTLRAKIYPRDKRLIQQVPVHTLNYIVLQAIATTSIHTKKKIQSQE